MIRLISINIQSFVKIEFELTEWELFALFPPYLFDQYQLLFTPLLCFAMQVTAARRLVNAKVPGIAVHMYTPLLG